MVENLVELRVLVSCARLGSLSAAARQLNMTPAAASAALKRLEGRLSVRLVERTTRALRLTPAGETFHTHALAALELLDEASSQIGEHRRELQGLIRLTAPSDLTRRLILPFLDAFLALHPGVSLRLHVSDRLQDLLRDEVDMALRYGDLPDSQLVAKPIAVTRRVACASPDYLAKHALPGSPLDLSQHDCITFGMRNRPEQHWRFWRVGSSLAPLVIKVSGRRQCDDGEIAQRWALAGYGVVYKSELDVRASLQSGALVRLFPDHVGESLPLNAVLPSQRFMPQRVRALAEFLAERLQAAPDQPPVKAA